MMNASFIEPPWKPLQPGPTINVMSIVRVFNESKQVAVADRVTLADTSETRRTGLLKHESLPKGEGLWITPCEAVHTFRMKFPIDVVFIDKHKRVTKIVPAMKKSRMAMSWRARGVVELTAGLAAETGMEVGDQLAITPLEEQPK